MGGLRSQQVANTREGHVHEGTQRVDRQAPGLRGALAHDHDLIIDAALRLHVLLSERLARGPVGEARAALDDDVAPAEFAVCPARLLQHLAGQHQAEDGGEHDQEDARARVLALRRGHPGHGVEWGGHLVLEDHEHHHCHGRVAVHRGG